MTQVKNILLFCIFFFGAFGAVHAQVSGSFTVNGDLTKYYPVTFNDSIAWFNNIATQLEIGRSSLHNDSTYRGSIIAKFSFHTTQWGNGSNFIDADIKQTTTVNPKLIAGWRDASILNGSYRVIIWLRGRTSYSYRSNYPVNPVVYDGIQNPLPFQEVGGPAHSYKTTVDSTVNNYGMSYGNTAYFNGTGNNYFAGKIGISTTNPIFSLQSASYNNTGAASSFLWGQYYGTAVGVPGTSSSYYAFHVISNVNQNAAGLTGGAKSLFFVRPDGNIGIGTTTPQAKLAVNGDIFAQKIKVTQTGWPDYIFGEDYALPSLAVVEKYINEHKHLPDIPAASAVEKDGLDVGDMNKKLLQKVEELTLYIISLNKKNEALEQRLSELELQTSKK
ncbi:hypothetical protein [Chitinophaga sp. GbtcB8]|uniref:hypothetical protein n=1 Tax=Chitinophaga sp. GbtcB8 TaxID=2824753 RepID=UPI001C30869B|nr:hypothetical protein [Chitinophaga sp. GbtcB8]